jgi:NADPH:quinone reductase
MHVVCMERPGPPEVLQYVEVPDPTPGPDEVVVDVAVAAVTFVETMMRAGRSPHPDDGAPRVLGNGVAGSVVAIGEHVADSWLGEAVVTTTGGTGGYAEQVAVPASELHRIPSRVDQDTACALLADGRTALALHRAAEVGPGDRVLVTAAAGGVGSLLVQLARDAGARVIALASAEVKLSLATKLGAHAAVNYRLPDWSEAVVAATDGHGADVVFDGVGGVTGATLLGLTAPGGRYVVQGMASGSFAPVDEVVAEKRSVRIIPLRSVLGDPAASYDLVEEALAAAAAGTLTPTIGQKYPLRDAAAAHAAMEARSTLGKTLLRP